MIGCRLSFLCALITLQSQLHSFKSARFLFRRYKLILYRLSSMTFWRLAYRSVWHAAKDGDSINSIHPSESIERISLISFRLFEYFFVQFRSRKVSIFLGSLPSALFFFSGLPFFCRSHKQVNHISNFVLFFFWLRSLVKKPPYWF